MNQRMYLVRVKLELGPQNSGGDIVHNICSTHLATPTKEVEAKSSIGIVLISNRVRGRIDDCPKVGEVLHGGRGHGDWGEDDAGDDHRAEE